MKNYFVFTSILIGLLLPVCAADSQDQNAQTLSPKAQRWIEAKLRWLECHPEEAMEELRFIMRHRKEPYRSWAAAELLRRNPTPYHLSEIIVTKEVPETLKERAWENLEKNPELESLWNILHQCAWRPWPFNNRCKEYSRKAGKLLGSMRKPKKD